MTEKSVPATPAVRNRVSSGYARLDEALQGGFLAGSMVVLNAPASEEVPILLERFLVAQETSLLICRTLSSAETITRDSTPPVNSLVCSDKPLPPSKNVIPGKGIDSLTDVNLQIVEAVASLQPKRVVLDILSDVLLRHKALQTRKWLTELLERLRAKNVTTLALLNPYMHSSEEVQAVVDLFDGNIEIFEKEVDGQLGKYLRIKWVHGIDVSQREFQLEGLTEKAIELQPITRQVGFREPRWLTPLVGRKEELSKLKTAYRDAQASKSSIVVIHGESGAGTSRLLRELTSYAQSEGAIVLTGRGTEDRTPYAPWVELLREYVAQLPSEALRRIIGSNAAHLARLVPDITVKLGTIPPAKSVGEQQDKIRLFETITQLLIASSKEQPLLVLLDDMEWADQASTELLEYFVRSTGNLRILIICGYRTEELEPESALDKTLMRLNRERVLEDVALKNLTADETARLITEIFGEPNVSSELVSLIYQRTGGNPFFVEEVLRSLVEDGTIYRNDKGWERKPIQELTVPKSVKAALESRVKKLDPDTLNALVIASVIGFDFDFDVLREVSGSEEDPLLERLEKALASGLTEEPGKEGLFRFVDSRIRELLLGNLSKVRRGRYHQKIAEAIEKVYIKNLDQHAEAIATHCYEAGDTQRCIKYSIIAGDRNRSIHAYEQSVTDYKRALELMDLEGAPEDQEAAIQEKMGACYGFISRLQESTQCYEKALAAYERLHDNQACARVCRGVSLAIVNVKSEPGSLEAISSLRKGLQYIEGEPESAEAASTYFQLAFQLQVMDQFEEALVWAKKAREVGERTQNFGAVVGALMQRGAYLTDTGKIDEGVKLLEEAYIAASKIEDLYLARTAAFNLSFYTYPRNLTKAHEWASKSLEISKRANVVIWEARDWWLLSVLDWLGGDWTRAIQASQKADSIFLRLNTGSLGVVEYVAWKGLFALSMGDLQKAEEALEEAQRLVERAPKLTIIVTVNLALGLLRLEQGREQEAILLFERAVEAFKPYEFTTEPLLHIETLTHLTSIYSRRGQREEAQKTFAWAKRLAETLKSDAGLAMAAQAEAGLLLASGDLKGAGEAYLECLRLWEKAGWPYYHAKALVEYSEAIADSKPDESKKRLENAAEIFRRLGAKRDLEKALAKLSIKPPVA